MQIDNDYPKSKLSDSNSKIWNLLSLLAISLCFIILLLQWQLLPFFLDMYYHLAVAEGFNVAGGVVGHNFWEYGPQGAPHLYPPLLHLLILGFLKMGFDEITTLRFFSLLMPALLLFTLWNVIKNILNRRTAFFTIFLSLCPSLFIISASFTPAATLGITLLLLGIYSIHRERWLSSILFFGLIFYVHIGIAVISIFYLILAKAFRITETKRFLMIFSLSILIGSPWLFHIIRNLSDISYQAIASMPIGFYPVILIFFMAGLRISLKKIKEDRVFLALFLSTIPMGLSYPFRFFCAQGMAGFLILAGIGLEKFYSLIDKDLRRNKTARKYTVFFLAVLLLYLIFFAPSLFLDKNGVNFKISDSLLTSIFEGKERKPEHILSSNISDKRFFNRLAGYVKKHTEKGEFIWSNYRYITGILWAMTERPSLSHMLREIRNKKASVNIRQAGLLIIIDEPQGEFLKIYNRIKDSFKTEMVEKEEGTDIYILINKNLPAIARYKIPAPIISTNLAYILLAVYVLSIIYSRLLSCKK